MDKSLLKRIIVSYGVLALHSLQKSANKDYKLKDFKIEHLADEIEVMIDSERKYYRNLVLKDPAIVTMVEQLVRTEWAKKFGDEEEVLEDGDE